MVLRRRDFSCRSFRFSSGWRGSRRRVWRVAAICLLAMMPVQFAYYAVDYFTDYRRRSGGWMEHNMRGALTQVMRRTGVADGQRVYIASDIAWADEYWRFFAI